MNRVFRDPLGGTLFPQGSVVCMGAFDGLHRGHQALVRQAVADAHAHDLPAVAVSFEPLPREFFAGAEKPQRLMLPRDKVIGLRRLGADAVGLLRFNSLLTRMTAEDFIDEVLVRRLRARAVWVGPDFRFGHGRTGDMKMLRAEGAAKGFRACEIEGVEVGEVRVSSTGIRAALAAGDFDQVTYLLGRPYAISGRVVRGQQLGRTLGYPTANIRYGNYRPALQGIFAVRVHGIDDFTHAGVASFGTRPTVDGVEPLLEAHVFNFEGDLYGRHLEIEFVQKLRDEIRFDSLDDLILQMRIDDAQARAILGVHPESPSLKDNRANA